MALNCTFDEGHAKDNALGLIVLKTDETLEVESRSVFAAADIACFHARIPNHPLVTNETLAEMERDLPNTASLLPPGIHYGAIGYACTSGATVIGQENIAAGIHAHHPDASVTDPITAVMAGLRALNARKIGVLTPYLPEVTQGMRALLEREGFEIAALGSFEQIEDRQIARISEQSTYEAVVSLSKTAACDAFFASCTNLSCFGIIKAAEAATGKPMISSNQALSWHMLTLAGVATRGMGPGRLFDV